MRTRSSQVPLTEMLSSRRSIIVGDANPFNWSPTARCGGTPLIVTQSPDTPTVSGGAFFPLVLSIAVLFELSGCELRYTRCRGKDDGSESRGWLLEVIPDGGGFFSLSR
jgi:hypothetical protein